MDYAIRAALDTGLRSIRAEERITYTNNSPDTLRYLWLQLDQNVFNSESRGLRLFDQRSRFGTGGAEGGMRILKVAQPAVAAARGRVAAAAAPLAWLVNGTMMKVNLARPLPPKGRQVLDISLVLPLWPQPQSDGSRGDRRRRWSTRWRSGIPASPCTTTSVAGTRSSTTARASSTWSTAAST